MNLSELKGKEVRSYVTCVMLGELLEELIPVPKQMMT